MDHIPSSLRGLRACLSCSLIKNFNQFEKDGCDNCEVFLKLKGNRDSVLDCTSSSFEGMIAVMSPGESWVAKWQRTDKCVMGMYAISVNGELPEVAVRQMTKHGLKYKSRDLTTK